MAPVLACNTSNSPQTVDRAGHVLEPGGWAVLDDSEKVTRHVVDAGLLTLRSPTDIDFDAEDLDPAVAGLREQLEGTDAGGGGGGSAAPPAVPGRKARSGGNG